MADEASRWFKRAGEWELNTRVFHSLTKVWGEPEIDLFAIFSNKKCKKFISIIYDPRVITTDAFSLNWSNVNAFIFPPFSLVSKVLEKIKQQRPQGILLLPQWPTQPWWTMAESLHAKDKRVIPVEQETLLHPVKAFPLKGKMKLLCLRI